MNDANTNGRLAGSTPDDVSALHNMARSDSQMTLGNGTITNDGEEHVG